jgi:hypothetical protein
VIGFYSTWQEITIVETKMKISHEGQITERFSRAIDQLENEKNGLRI